MKKHIYIQLILLFLAGWAQAQNFTGVWNASMVNDKSKVDPNIEYHLTQNGNTITGEIIHKKENMRASLTGTMANKEVAGTLKYDKNPWHSLDQKFRIFIRANDNATMFMHESTKGARFFGGPIFKNQTLTSQQANKAQAATSLQKGTFSKGSGTVVQKATGTPKVGVQMAMTPKKTARNIGGYYRIEGMADASGTKRNLFVNVRNFPDNKDKSKAYGEALILGNAYGIGSPEGRLFGYETNEDDVTVMFDPIYENNSKNTRANGRIAVGSNGTYLVAPKLGYKMIKISQAEAERESKKLSATVKVRVEYKFIYLSSSLFWDTSVGNSFHGLAKKLPIELYGTGSIRAYRETSSGTSELNSLGNTPARVFDIPKSRSQNKHDIYYFDKEKNLTFGGSRPIYFGFYKFAKDAELEKSNDHSNQAIFRVDRVREFEVNRAALEGETERVAINGQAHLSNKLASGDINFGNIHRRVYLHELTNPRKLTNYEQYYNRMQEGKGEAEHGPPLVNPPYYFFANLGGMNPPIMISFTVEIID
ncbi:hypothetical protein LZF95_17255 [Algoriphagus sp. AGSA1]|uniref:hypothetical protein n=1 Tax=Algoriphagus sp. AGSA1 TaxID=2907213 RepID=UPI001F170352|nr:hypothetical protein [Algoriphagus sp. AGSA1]MCE7056435.1 hypothetical protein [Algoriphagus sp. AGSA1]